MKWDDDDVYVQCDEMMFYEMKWLKENERKEIKLVFNVWNYITTMIEWIN